jgi:hypothetical protein
MFANIFFNLLKEEADQLKEEFAYQGYPNVFAGSSSLTKKTTIPKSSFTKNNIDRNSRHRAAIPRDPGFRKHPQLVPTYQKAKNRIHKVEMAKTGAKQVLSQNEIEDVRKRYNLSALHPSAPKKLGNTGVMIRFDPQLRGYILHK